MSNRSSHRTWRFGFLLTEQFSLLAFSGFVETLRELEDHTASRGQACSSWDVLGSRSGAVESSCRVSVGATATYDEASDCDFVVIIGGRNEAVLPGGAMEFLKRCMRRKRTVIAIDTGVFAVARAGLMLDRQFCVHWFHYREFVSEFPALRASMDQIFIEDGNFVSCAGGTWAADLAAHLVAELWGRPEADRVTSLMGLERMRSPSHFQTPFFDGAPVVADRVVRAAIQMIERRSHAPPSVPEMAGAVGLSTKQLHRRFQAALDMSPTKFSRTLRLRYADWMLRSSGKPISQIAEACGFADQSHFTRLYVAEFGRTPRSTRTTPP